MAGASMRRLLRDRTAMFFVVVLPILIILILGVTLRGNTSFRVAVVDQGAGRLGEDLLAGLRRSPALEVRTDADLASARIALRRAELDAVVVLPAGLDADLRAGRLVDVVVYGERTSTSQQAARATIAAVVGSHAGRVQAARFASEQSGVSIDDALRLVDEIAASVTPVRVDARDVGSASRYLPRGFGYSAPTMLVLFVFVNTLAGGAAMIQTRRLGMYDRMTAAPVAAGAIVAGETLCYLGMALFQSALIVGVGAVVFGVDWGPPLAAVALVGTWALVGTGAGMLSGTLFRTPEQAGSIGPPIGIAFGMLGGCMWPLEIVGSTMRTIGHAVPHAWAVDAWITLLSKGGGLADIAPSLAVLGGFAAAFLGLAIVRFRRDVAA